MILFLVLLILLVSAIVLVSLFAPHLFPWYRPHLILNPADSDMVRTPASTPVQPVIMEGLADPDPEPARYDPSLEEKIVRLENILLEKNAVIEKLQRQVTAEKAHRTEFEKVKAILDEEIVKLRKQNKELKAKTGETV